MLYLHERTYILALVSVHLEWAFNWTIVFVLIYTCGGIIIYYRNHDVSTAIGGNFHPFSLLVLGNFWLTCNIMDHNNNSFQFIFYGRKVPLHHWFIQFVRMVAKFTFKYLHQP